MKAMLMLTTDETGKIQIQKKEDCMVQCNTEEDGSSKARHVQTKPGYLVSLFALFASSRKHNVTLDCLVDVFCRHNVQTLSCRDGFWREASTS